MATRHVTSMPVTNPYTSPLHPSLAGKRKRFSPFIAGLVGLAMGAGFCCVIAVISMLSFFVQTPGSPGLSGIATLTGVAILYVFLLILWVGAQRRLYRRRQWVLWILAMAAWLLAPLFVTVELFLIFMFSVPAQ